MQKKPRVLDKIMNEREMKEEKEKCNEKNGVLVKRDTEEGGLEGSFQISFLCRIKDVIL